MLSRILAQFTLGLVMLSNYNYYTIQYSFIETLSSCRASILLDCTLKWLKYYNFLPLLLRLFQVYLAFCEVTSYWVSSPSNCHSSFHVNSVRFEHNKSCKQCLLQTARLHCDKFVDI